MKGLEAYSARCKPKLKEWMIPFFVIFAIYTIGISAIIRANFNYIDDIGRVAYGYKGWDSFSRYLSNFFSEIIHADSYLTDVSPLAQMIAVVILSIVALMMLNLFTNKSKFNIWHYIAIVPVGLSPYFLECISYKYDAPYMALSILAAVAPLLFRKKEIWIYGIASMVGAICVCTTYQAACGIFPMLVAALALRDWTKGENNRAVFKRLLVSFAGYLIGLVFFMIFMMQSVDAYVSSSVDVSGVLGHWVEYYKYVKSDFKKEWIVLVCVIAVAFVVAITKGSSKNKIITLILAVCTGASMGVMAFGVYPALASPLYSPRAMYGFGILIAILMIEVSSEIRIYWGKIASLLLSWMFFVFSFTYGNALYVQKQYTDYRMTLVAEEINSLTINDSGQSKELQVTGSIGRAPVIRNMPQDYNMLNRLVPITFSGGWGWGEMELIGYYDLKNISSSSGNDFTNLDLPVLVQTPLYTIRGDDFHILVELSW